MARWGNTVFDNNISEMRSSYQAAFDNRRAFNISELNDTTAYAKAHVNSHPRSKFSNQATSYDNNRLNFITGGYKSNPAAGILPTISKEVKTKNFIHENFKDAGRSPRRLNGGGGTCESGGGGGGGNGGFQKGIGLEKKGHGELSLESFIENYKTSRSQRQTPLRTTQSDNRNTRDAENKVTTSLNEPNQTRQNNNEFLSQILSSPSRQVNKERSKGHNNNQQVLPVRAQSPFSHVTSQNNKQQFAHNVEHNSRGKCSFYDTTIAATSNQNPSSTTIHNEGLGLNLDGVTASRDSHPLSALQWGTSPTAGNQKSPRRYTQRHTVAMVDRDGNMVRWVENSGDPTKRYDSVADIFDEKLKRKDAEMYSQNYGNRFEEETEKQISGTFGAEGRPLPSRIDTEALKLQLKRSQNRRNRNQESSDILQLDRPKLYRNITSWRGDNQWGESTYNSTFNQLNQNELSELERLMALPLRDVAPKSGLKNVVEVSTNTGRRQPALFMT